LEVRQTLIIIGERIRTERKRAGFSQTELAARVGYSMNGLAKIERGESDPKFSAIAKIADALGISVDALLATKPGPPSEALGAIQKSLAQLVKNNEEVLAHLRDSDGSRPGVRE